MTDETIKAYVLRRIGKKEMFRREAAEDAWTTDILQARMFGDHDEAEKYGHSLEAKKHVIVGELEIDEYEIKEKLTFKIARP